MHGVHVVGDTCAIPEVEQTNVVSVTRCVAQRFKQASFLPLAERQQQRCPSRWRVALFTVCGVAPFGQCWRASCTWMHETLYESQSNKSSVYCRLVCLSRRVTESQSHSVLRAEDFFGSASHQVVLARLTSVGSAGPNCEVRVFCPHHDIRTSASLLSHSSVIAVQTAERPPRPQPLART